MSKDKEPEVQSEVQDLKSFEEETQKRERKLSRWVKVAVGFGVIAIIIAIIFASCSSQQASRCASQIASIQNNIATLKGLNGLDGLSAYQVWLSNGNTGTPVQFIDSLKGTDGKDGLSVAGESDYQVWLKEGNEGSAQDFLESLIGKSGKNGIDGLNGESAYQVWLKNGHSGTITEFLASLVGTNGTSGVNGLSAYQVWLTQSGNEDKSVEYFLNSLKGANGTNGVNGLNGINGASAYQVWLDNGNEGGTVEQFFESIRGPQGTAGTCSVGDTGATGAVGPQGEVGPAGPQGEQGPVGAQGIQGAAGTPFTLQGSYPTLADFEAGAGATDGVEGQGWLIESDGSIMVWTVTQGWIDAGDIMGPQGPMGPQGIQGPMGIQGLQGEQGPAGTIADSYYGAWYSSTTQTAPEGTRIRMYFENMQVQNGIHTAVGIDGKYSDIVFEHDGVYNLQFSAQLHNTGGSGSGQNFIIWLGENGNNVPMSATDVTVNTNGPWMVASWNFYIVAKAGDTAQLFWQNDKESLQIEATTGNGVPGIPSVILTVNRVG